MKQSIIKEVLTYIIRVEERLEDEFGTGEKYELPEIYWKIKVLLKDSNWEDIETLGITEMNRKLDELLEVEVTPKEGE